MMETEQVNLFILDISGYTRFMVNTDLVHGKETISEILNRLFDFVPEGLVLNKIEGDALFFYTREMDKKTLSNISKDVYHYFNQTVLQEIDEAHRMCKFSLCRNIHDLNIKFFIHTGEVAFHTLGEFKELIGRSVIEIHRVMKNSVNNDSYILTIDDAGEYFDKYKYLGKINYNVMHLDDDSNKISVKLLNRIVNPYRNI